MKTAPRINISILTIFSLGTENSSMITSEQEIYVKVPAARDMKMISMIIDSPETMIPITTPRGVAAEKSITRMLTSLMLLANVF